MNVDKKSIKNIYRHKFQKTVSVKKKMTQGITIKK